MVVPSRSVLGIWLATILVTVVAGLCLWGTVLEIQRGFAKKAWLEAVAVHQQHPACTLDQWQKLDPSQRSFRPIQLTKKDFDVIQLAWGPRYRQGRLGWHGLLALTSHRAWVVDWGWFAKVPALHSQPLVVEARPLPSANPWVQRIQWRRHRSVSTPGVVHQLDAPSLARALKRDEARWYFVAKSGQPGVGVVDVQPLTQVPPWRHWGYAGQFFIFAVLGLGGYLKLLRG